MPDEQNETSTESTEVEGQEPDAEQEAGSTEEQEPTDADGAEDKDDDGNELSPAAKKALSKVRAEAAGWRTQLREAQEALKNAKTPEDFAAVQADFDQKLKAKDRELVLARNPLPDELASLLKGDTVEELEAHAKSLAKFVTPTPSDDEGDLGGGLDPSDQGDDADSPAALAKRLRRNRRTF